MFAIVNKTAINMHAQTYVFISLEYIPRSEIAGSYGNSVELFDKLPDYFLKRLQYFTFSSAMHEGSNSSTSLPLLVIICLFTRVILVGVSISLQFELHCSNV